MLKRVILFVALVITSAQLCHAAVIWENPITGTNPNASNPFTIGQTFDALLTVSGIGRGSGITGDNANNRFSAVSWNTVSIDLDAYFTFTLTPNAGQKIDFGSFAYTGQASGTGPTSFELRSSIDGFTSSIGIPTATGATISLAGISFQNLTTAIEFRLYAWGASSGAGSFSVNDFSFDGIVSAVPEPTTAVMLLGGIGTVLLLRRRRVN